MAHARGSEVAGSVSWTEKRTELSSFFFLSQLSIFTMYSFYTRLFTGNLNSKNIPHIHIIVFNKCPLLLEVQLMIAIAFYTLFNTARRKMDLKSTVLPQNHSNTLGSSFSNFPFFCRFIFNSPMHMHKNTHWNTHTYTNARGSK